MNKEIKERNSCIDQLLTIWYIHTLLLIRGNVYFTGQNENALQLFYEQLS